MSGDQKHQYHLVEPSPWPAVGAAAGFTLVLGLTMFMHDYSYSIYNGSWHSNGFGYNVFLVERCC